MDEKPFEHWRDLVIDKVAWFVAGEQNLDVADVKQDLWVWLLSENRHGECRQDRWRRLLAPDQRHFKTVLMEATSAARRGFAEQPEPVAEFADEAVPIRPRVPLSVAGPLSAALDSLQPVDREILSMVAEGLCSADIGKALGLSAANVRQRKLRAIGKLRADESLFDRSRAHSRETRIAA